MQELALKIKEAVALVRLAQDLKVIESLKTEYLGKTGVLTKAMQQLSSYSPEEKKQAGQKLNLLKQDLITEIENKTAALKHEATNLALAAERIDVTIPARELSRGGVHLLSAAMDEISDIFKVLGFGVEFGPEIEDEFHNFTSLNIPEHHPARQMHDTFYLDDTRLLRTHTSTVQVRAMNNKKPPFRFISLGRVYRCDSDRTHTPMFHQVEGVYVDKGVNMAHLKGILTCFLKMFFVQDIQIRLRPSFFPFTEPSAEVDISTDNGNTWLEILGCGMVHPNVLKNLGIDHRIYSGFAFGMGIERLTMLKYGISDLRQMYEGDIRWLKQHGKPW